MSVTAVGVDVGGRRKGFHAVALADGRFATTRTFGDVGELVDWCCRELAAQVIAVDAPCSWSVDGRARPAERELMQLGIWCFSTPTRAQAIAHRTDYYGWMRRGEELFHALQDTHPLCTELPTAGAKCCFETFPHAITWNLRGGNALARQKRNERPEQLKRAGIHLDNSASIDVIDAALCALTAHLAISGEGCVSFGEAETGIIIVPAKLATRI